MKGRINRRQYNSKGNPRQVDFIRDYPVVDINKAHYEHGYRKYREYCKLGAHAEFEVEQKKKQAGQQPPG